MGLKDFRPERQLVDMGNGDTFPVFAIDPSGMLTLAMNHLEVLREVYGLAVESINEFMAKRADDDTIEMADIEPMIGAVPSIIKSGPDFLADMIVIGAREPDCRDIVLTLPLGVQIDAAIKIFNLTLKAEGGLVKLGEAMSGVLKMATTQAGLAKSPEHSMSGSST